MADKIDDGGAAFPQNDLSGYGIGPSMLADGHTYDIRGMSLLEHYAGQIAPAFVEVFSKLPDSILLGAMKGAGFQDGADAFVAKRSFDIAEAMVAEALKRRG